MLFRTKAQLLWRVFLSQATLFPQQVEAVYRLRGRTEVGLGSGQGLASCSEVRLCGADRLHVLGFFSCATVQRLCDILGRGNALLIVRMVLVSAPPRTVAIMQPELQPPGGPRNQSPRLLRQP